MTNEELMQTNPKLLSHLEAQERYLLEDAGMRCPCPVCGHEMNKFEAAGIAINAYSFGANKEPYACTRCEVPLEAAVPFIKVAAPTWIWRRDFARVWSRDPVTNVEGDVTGAAGKEGTGR